MALKNSERKLLCGILREVLPYTLEIQSIQGIIQKHLESTRSMPGFMKQLEESVNVKSSILRTDLRIYIAGLRKGTKD
jgi:hypothetical protein